MVLRADELMDVGMIPVERLDLTRQVVVSKVKDFNKKIEEGNIPTLEVARQEIKVRPLEIEERKAFDEDFITTMGQVDGATRKIMSNAIPDMLALVMSVCSKKDGVFKGVKATGSDIGWRLPWIPSTAVALPSWKLTALGAADIWDDGFKDSTTKGTMATDAFLLVTMLNNHSYAHTPGTLYPTVYGVSFFVSSVDYMPVEAMELMLMHGTNRTPVIPIPHVLIPEKTSWYMRYIATKILDQYLGWGGIEVGIADVINVETDIGT